MFKKLQNTAQQCVFLSCERQNNYCTVANQTTHFTLEKNINYTMLSTQNTDISLTRLTEYKNKRKTKISLQSCYFI